MSSAKVAAFLSSGGGGELTRWPLFCDEILLGDPSDGNSMLDQVTVLYIRATAHHLTHTDQILRRQVKVR